MSVDPERLFPYEIRPIQVDIMESSLEAIRDGSNTIIEAGTGAGKTVSVLVSAIHKAYTYGKRVLYLTRTNSQQRQVVQEFKMVKEKAGPVEKIKTEPKEGKRKDVVEEIIDELNSEIGRENDEKEGESNIAGVPWEGGPSRALCSAIQGRANMCPLTSEEPEFITGTPEELSKMCSQRKRNTTDRMMGKGKVGKECPYYAAFLLDEGMEVREWARKADPTAEEMASRCLHIGICPYEVTKLLVSESVLVTAPYIYFLSPFIRRRLLEWMDCSIEDLIVIVDEAHNLANFARDICSLSLSSNSLGLAEAELEKEGDHVIGRGYTISNFLDGCRRTLMEIAEEFLIDEDGLVPPSSFSESMMSHFRTSSNMVEDMASEMLQYGVSIQDRKKAQGKLPRSYIHNVARFYLMWQELEFCKYSPLIVKGRREGELSLEAFAMDPSVITSAMSEAHSSIHLSGTLSPLEEYRDTIGLPEYTPLVRLPPPFPASNRMVVYMDDLTTNYEALMKDPGLKERYRERLASILEGTPDTNTAIFFPSFGLLESIMGNRELEDGSNLDTTFPTKRELYIEKKGSSQTELMDLADRFRKSRGGVLVSVLGGRLSEGMDFPGRSLEIVIIVGIPYPKPTARQRALASYYDIRFGKGWEYTVHAPASRRLQQAIGRMIRGEDERGFASILDRRAFHFRRDIPDMRQGREDLDDLKGFLYGKA